MSKQKFCKISFESFAYTITDKVYSICICIATLKASKFSISRMQYHRNNMTFTFTKPRYILGIFTVCSTLLPFLLPMSWSAVVLSPHTQTHTHTHICNAHILARMHNCIARHLTIFSMQVIYFIGYCIIFCANALAYK